jgi:hypothetical protein
MPLDIFSGIFDNIIEEEGDEDVLCLCRDH